jgi:hypothetical protein
MGVRFVQPSIHEREDADDALLEDDSEIDVGRFVS